jgi:glycosyltransferase involved in cell wall biosynthesis
MRVALVGSRGVPARYGGFETAVEEVGAGLAARGHDVVVYCRERSPAGRQYRGMRRVVLPALRRRSLETLSHTGACTPHLLLTRPDAVLVFNAANAPWVALLRVARLPVALHIDGHDARRAKWRGLGGRYYRLATRWGFAVADEVVADSRAVAEETSRTYGRTPTYIPYGARPRDKDQSEVARSLAPHGLEIHGYHLVVARFEPENHVLEILRAYARSAARTPLVVVGFAGYSSDYLAEIERVAAGEQRIRLLGAVWDQDLLDDLYAGAATYVHGHSVGGTNPSLLRAMAQRTPALVYDCAYNQETTGGYAHAWREEATLSQLLEQAEREPTMIRAAVDAARDRVTGSYTWPLVVDEYEALAARLSRSRRSKHVGSAG